MIHKVKIVKYKNCKNKTIQILVKVNLNNKNKANQIIHKN